LADSHGIFYIYSKESVVFNVAKKSDRRAPSSVLTPELRKKMGEAAVLVLNPVIIWSGTVEFLLMKTIISFPEMNTLTSRASSYGIYYWTDLVEQQIKVAR
jgi:propionyl-CoA carboxylase alpha chain